MTEFERQLHQLADRISPKEWDAANVLIEAFEHQDRLRSKGDVFLKMTIQERVEFILAFNALRDALALPPSYEKASAYQDAERRVAASRRVMAEALSRPMPEQRDAPAE